MTDILAELLGEPQKLGSAQCPRCSKFARVLREWQGHDGDWNMTVDCKRCGVQTA